MIIMPPGTAPFPFVESVMVILLTTSLAMTLVGWRRSDYVGYVGSIWWMVIALVLAAAVGWILNGICKSF